MRSPPRRHGLQFYAPAPVAGVPSVRVVPRELSRWPLKGSEPGESQWATCKALERLDLHHLHRCRTGLD